MKTEGLTSNERHHTHPEISSEMILCLQLTKAVTAALADTFNLSSSRKNNS